MPPQKSPEFSAPSIINASAAPHINAGSISVYTTGLEINDDCNGNGESDFCDLAGGISLDCNDNGIPDECETAVDPGVADFVSSDFALRAVA